MKGVKIKGNGKRSYRMSDRQEGPGVSGFCWVTGRAE